MKEMSKVLYAFFVCSLMYVMVCTRPNITHAVGAAEMCCIIHHRS